VIITKVATVIVTWNKLHDVCSLLRDITHLDIKSIQLDTYVVDNNSSDGTQTYIQQHYPYVKVLQTGSNLGGSGGFSHGLQIVSKLGYDYLWLLDNDVRLDSLALRPLVETLENHAEVGLVGSQIRKLDRPDTIQEVGSFINSIKAHLKTNFGNCRVTPIEEILAGEPYVTVDVCAAASLLVRREVVQQIGLFEDYFLHFDDVEWCLRAKQASWVVACNPASIIWHSSADFKSRPWINYYDERNLCYCWQKYQPHLVLKRLFVSSPRLLYYAATGRYFLTEVTLQGFQDFAKGIRGKIPQELCYVEHPLEAIITHSSKVMVQSTIHQDGLQNRALKKMESSKEITIWLAPENLGHHLWLWISACFYKPVDIALVTYRHPNLYALNAAKYIYFFTGSGYVYSPLNALTLIRDVAKTIIQLWQVYWNIIAARKSMPS